MSRLIVFTLVVAIVRVQGSSLPPAAAAKGGLRIDVAALAVTPFGKRPDWNGTIT